MTQRRSKNDTSKCRLRGPRIKKYFKLSPTDPVCGLNEFNKYYDGRVSDQKTVGKILSTFFDLVIEDIIVDRKVFTWPRVGRFFMRKKPFCGFFRGYSTKIPGLDLREPSKLTGDKQFILDYDRTSKRFNLGNYHFFPTKEVRARVNAQIKKSITDPYTKDYDAISFR